MTEAETELLSKSAEKLFRKTCEFIAGATSLESIPDSQIPEIAFAGRSNVGKSSLLNTLLHRKNLARVSKTPGCTRQINFYSLGGDLNFADLPGYGYAKVSKDEVAVWEDLIKKYLAGRPNLKRVFLLIDSRHGLKESDRDIMSLLDEAAVSYQIILTKVDKQKKSRIEGEINAILNLSEKHPALHPDVLQTSSFSFYGLDSLRNVIDGLKENK